MMAQFIKVHMLMERNKDRVNSNGLMVHGTKENSLIITLKVLVPMNGQMGDTTKEPGS